MKKHIIILTLMTVLFCTPAISKTFSTNRVDSKEDWSVFMENNPSQCWIVSAPSRTKATRNGKSIKVIRSEIQLFALFEPSQSIYGQISFTSGYPFKNGSAVTVSIGSSETHVITDGWRMGMAKVFRRERSDIKVFAAWCKSIGVRYFFKRH